MREEEGAAGREGVEREQLLLRSNFAMVTKVHMSDGVVPILQLAFGWKGDAAHSLPLLLASISRFHCPCLAHLDYAKEVGRGDDRAVRYHCHTCIKPDQSDSIISSRVRLSSLQPPPQCVGIHSELLDCDFRCNEDAVERVAVVCLSHSGALQFFQHFFGNTSPSATLLTTTATLSSLFLRSVLTLPATVKLHIHPKSSSSFRPSHTFAIDCRARTKVGERVSVAVQQVGLFCCQHSCGPPEYISAGLLIKADIVEIDVSGRGGRRKNGLANIAQLSIDLNKGVPVTQLVFHAVLRTHPLKQ
mmetsp:Transcript_35046/g.90903  ORF Transcript_35046/g.90903 Transcript_35046/m.90903 type:complete len:302 (-) Transcript_35046:279-1184(-)